MTTVSTKYFAVIYKANNRKYGWRCRDKDSDYSKPDECCMRRWGIRSEENARLAVERHLRERHNGGTIFLAYKKDPKTNVWPKMIVS